MRRILHGTILFVCGGDTQHPVAGLADDYSVGEIVAASLEIFSKGHHALSASLSVVESGYFDIVKTSLFVHCRVVERAETDETVVQSAGMVFVSVYEFSVDISTYDGIVHVKFQVVELAGQLLVGKGCSEFRICVTEFAVRLDMAAEEWGFFSPDIDTP